MELSTFKAVMRYIEYNMDGEPSNEYFMKNKDYFFYLAELPDNFMEIMAQGAKIASHCEVPIFTQEQYAILRKQKDIVTKCRYAFVSLLARHIDHIDYIARALELIDDNDQELNWQEVNVLKQHIERLIKKTHKIRCRLGRRSNK